MLSSETKVVTYVNKRGERSTYPLNSAMESANLEMVKRLKYTKDILTHMLNANVATVGANGAKGDVGFSSNAGAKAGQKIEVSANNNGNAIDSLQAPYDQINPNIGSSQTNRP